MGRSHPGRGAWIETVLESVLINDVETSHPGRGAWIETVIFLPSNQYSTVAPRAGCVD